jgi:hypothetical protein
MNAFYDAATTRLISVAALAVINRIETKQISVAEADAEIDAIAIRYPGAERQQRFYAAMKALARKVDDVD